MSTSRVVIWTLTVKAEVTEISNPDQWEHLWFDLHRRTCVTCVSCGYIKEWCWNKLTLVFNLWLLGGDMMLIIGIALSCGVALLLIVLGLLGKLGKLVVSLTVNLSVRHCFCQQAGWWWNLMHLLNQRSYKCSCLLVFGSRLYLCRLFQCRILTSYILINVKM